jgi:uncharacterized membrane protein
VPENTLKFVVGIMLTTFGTFWGGEGVGIVWPLSDAFLFVLVAIYLAAAVALIFWLRPYGTLARPGFALQAATPDTSDLPVEQLPSDIVP